MSALDQQIILVFDISMVFFAATCAVLNIGVAMSGIKMVICMVDAKAPRGSRELLHVRVQKRELYLIGE